MKRLQATMAASAAFMAVFIAQSAGAQSGSYPSAASTTTAGTKMCPVFETRTWDTVGFTVPCDSPKAPPAIPARRCPMFSQPAWDQVGFTVACDTTPQPEPAPLRTCPMFSPPMWDNAGFRVAC